jgi:hypothetical protein
MAAKRLDSICEAAEERIQADKWNFLSAPSFPPFLSLSPVVSFSILKGKGVRGFKM